MQQQLAGPCAQGVVRMTESDPGDFRFTELGFWIPWIRDVDSGDLALGGEDMGRMGGRSVKKRLRAGKKGKKGGKKKLHSIHSRRVRRRARPPPPADVFPPRTKGRAPLAGWQGLIGNTVIRCGGPTRRSASDDWLRFGCSSTVPPAPHMTRAGITARRSVKPCGAR